MRYPPVSHMPGMDKPLPDDYSIPAYVNCQDILLHIEEVLCSESRGKIIKNYVICIRNG